MNYDDESGFERRPPEVFGDRNSELEPKTDAEEPVEEVSPEPAAKAKPTQAQKNAKLALGAIGAVAIGVVGFIGYNFMASSGGASAPPMAPPPMAAAPAPLPQPARVEAVEQRPMPAIEHSDRSTASEELDKVKSEMGAALVALAAKVDALEGSLGEANARIEKYEKRVVAPAPAASAGIRKVMRKPVDADADVPFRVVEDEGEVIIPPSPSVKTKKQPAVAPTAPAVNVSAADEYLLIAAISGQAWLQDRAGKVRVVHAGDVLPGGLRVMSISQDDGMVKTNRGDLKVE